MKQVILAAVAATAVLASAAQATTAPAKAETTTTTTTVTMDADACKKAIDACGADQACKDALVRDHGCKAE